MTPSVMLTPYNKNIHIKAQLPKLSEHFMEHHIILTVYYVLHAIYYVLYMHDTYYNCIPSPIYDVL